MPSNNDIENKSWLLATIIMASLAATIFFVQHFITSIFDLAVEISIFYIPAIVLVVFYLIRRFPKSSCLR